MPILSAVTTACSLAMLAAISLNPKVRGLVEEGWTLIGITPGFWAALLTAAIVGLTSAVILKLVVFLMRQQHGRA